MDDGRHISTAMENLWIDEVLYLHSLWHQGPRTRNPNNNLSPSPSTSFKKIKKKRRIRSNINTTRVESPPHSGDPLATPWPCPLPPISDHDSAVGWPSAAALPRSRGVAETKTATAAEQASFVAVQSQHAGVKACQEFFMDLDGGENDDDDEEGDSMDDDDEDVEGKSKRFEFFLGLLEGNPDLKEYYVKNWEKGEFTCLVCGGMKVKLWRRFVTLVALVQHANTIRRTKTKGAHRDFAKAVCQVLEWDIERLPSVASEAEHLSDGGLKNELGEDGDGEKKEGDYFQTKETLNSPIE